jgi:excisionase family DNA binding protein
MATMTNEDRLVMSAEAARLLGVTPDMVRKMAREGVLVAAETTANGVRLFRIEDVLRFHAERIAKRTAKASKVA